jgi:Ca2+-transporting ATPase
MRQPRSGILVNEVTRNPWLWGSLVLCTLLLAAPPYFAPLAHVLHLAPPTPAMWTVIFGLSAAPLLVTQSVTLMLALRRSRT